MSLFTPKIALFGNDPLDAKTHIAITYYAHKVVKMHDAL